MSITQQTSINLEPSPKTKESTKPFPYRQIIGLGVARCFFRASMVIVMSCNMEMLIKRVFNGDALAAQLMLTKINTIDTFISFWIGPIKSSFLECFGRKAGMVYPTLIMSATRAFYSYSPSRITYLLYRIVVQVCASFFAGYQSSLSDLIDPTTDQYTATTQMLDQAATVTGIVSLLAVRKYIKDPRNGMFLASSLYVMAAVVVHFTVDETLEPKNRKPMPWKRLLTNPLAPLTYFYKSIELMKFHLQDFLWDLAQGGQNAVLGTFRRQVHGWSMQENATQQFRGQVCDIIGSFGAIPMIRYMGLKGTYLLGRSLSILQTLVNIWAPSEWTFLTVMLVGVRYDMLALQREGSYWRQQVGATVSEKRSAEMNLFRILELFMPTLWVKLYASTAKKNPRTVFAVTLVLQLFALGMTPYLWPGSEMVEQKEKKKKERKKTE